MTRRPLRARLLAAALPLALASAASSATGAPPLYRDASQPAERRVEDLLARMTLAEKVRSCTASAKPAQGLTKARGGVSWHSLIWPRGEISKSFAVLGGKACRL